MAARIRAWLAREDGMTIPELLTAMSILAVVMTGILVVFVGGLHATTSMNARFQAQQNARLALSSLRYEVGFACSAAVPPGPPPDQTRVVLLLPDASTNSCSGSTNYATWCAESANSAQPFGLYRQTGQTCSWSTGVKRAGSLQTNQVFSNPTCTAGVRPQLAVSLRVDANLGTTTAPYNLSDTITMRNGSVC
ncbi:MAG TPA: type II secretion system protein [Gaiellaceae bacterium]|nr:type II secretion system protein [Gaiellaceae bacterium]